MNGTTSNNPQTSSARYTKPLPAGPTPPVPSTAPPAPPSHNNTTHTTRSNNHTPGTNGHNHSQRGKKRNDTPVDPATMYESLKNRIAALEEEEVIEEEEERRYGASRHSDLAVSYLQSVFLAEEAQKSVKGMEDNAIHAKYIELVNNFPGPQNSDQLTPVQFAELKRVERDHAKEKQKLMKDKDAGEAACRSYFRISRLKHLTYKQKVSSRKRTRPRPRWKTSLANYRKYKSYFCGHTINLTYSKGQQEIAGMSPGHQLSYS